jgi:hypothetical protein
LEYLRNTSVINKSIFQVPSVKVWSTSVLFPVWRGPKRKKDCEVGTLQILLIMMQKCTAFWHRSKRENDRADL